MLIVLGEEKNITEPLCVIFSSLLSLHPSYIQIFSSALCSQTLYVENGRLLEQLISLTMSPVNISETSVKFHESAWRNIPEVSILAAVRA
jgi:hypothetical protein